MIDLETALGLTLAVAVTFFLVVPGVGAVAVRSRWRRFRSALFEAALADSLRAEGDAALMRAWFGRLMAIEGEQRVWLQSADGDLVVDLHDTEVVVLPPEGSAAGRTDLPDESPSVLSWSDVGALAEGSRFLVLARSDEELVTPPTQRRSNPPVVILYDGPDERAFERAVWTGRQRNEYWNQLTPFALLGGFLAAAVLSVAVFDSTRLGALIALVAGAIPVLPLLPPGVFGYYVYRRAWRQARRLRAQRDLRYLRALARDPSSRLPQPEATPRATRLELVAVAVLLAGIGVNGYLAALFIALAM